MLLKEDAQTLVLMILTIQKSSEKNLLEEGKKKEIIRSHRVLHHSEM